MKLAILFLVMIFSSAIAEDLLLGYTPAQMAQMHANWKECFASPPANDTSCPPDCTPVSLDDTNKTKENQHTVQEMLPGLVPDGVFFLVSGSCGTPDRRGQIPVGTKLVFFSAINLVFFDWTDDVDSAECNSTARGSEYFIELSETTPNLYKNMTSYVDEPFVKKDGKDVSNELLWVNADDEFYFKSCPNGFQSCDSCDVPECEDFGGVDAYPIFGWYYADSEEWICGQEREYSFGYNITPNEGTLDPCKAVTTTLYTKECDSELGDSGKPVDSAALCGHVSVLQLFFGWILAFFGMFFCK